MQTCARTPVGSMPVLQQTLDRTHLVHYVVLKLCDVFVHLLQVAAHAGAEVLLDLEGIQLLHRVGGLRWLAEVQVPGVNQFLRRTAALLA